MAAIEGEAAATAAAYPCVAAAAAAAAAIMAGRLRPPGTNGFPSLTPTGGPPPPSVPPLGPGPPPGVPPPPLGPNPPLGPRPLLPALVNLLLGAPLQSHASALDRPGGPLVPRAIADAIGGWAGRPRAACPVPAPRYVIWRDLSPFPPRTGHAMAVCLVGRGPAPTLAPCVIPSLPATVCAPTPPASALASDPTLLSALSSFCSTFAQARGGSGPGRRTEGERGARSPDKNLPRI